ncbi:MAG: hypothetical protein ACK41U_10415 [Paracoccus sp. (in: a-proteobacteria)]|uniref:hypothetical protein n=1 Tax=Paracoccus sp. TaxID=267 RepID=UPI003918F1E9
MTERTPPDLPARRVVNDLGKSEFAITETGLQMVEELSARGCSVQTIARALGIGKDTFRAMRERDPAVQDALEQGRAVEHDALVGNLRAAADEGNIVANIFLLKSRHGYREGEAIDVNVSVMTGGVIVVPQRQSVEDFLRDIPPAPTPVRDFGLLEARLDPETRRGD